MPSEVAAGEVLATVPEGRLTLGRACEIEQRLGAPPTEQESAEYEAQRKRLASWWKTEIAPTPLLQQVKRQFEALEASGAWEASRQIQDRWHELTPRQERRFGEAKVRDAPLLLRLLPPPAIHAPLRRGLLARPREQRARRRRANASARGDPDPEPEPVAFVRGFTAASERLSRHLQRRDGARRFA